MALREEAFLDTLKIETASGVTYGVTRPTKYASNPIWPTLSGAGTVPDWGVGYITTRVNGSTTELFTTCFDGPNINTVHLGSPTTTDGVTISRPSRGLITFAGNTSNNLITPGGYTRNQYRVTWDATTSTYVCFAYTNDGSNYYIDLFQAASPQTTGWGARVKRITAPLGAGVATANACEPMALFRRADGRWFMYIQTAQPGTADYGGSRRHLGALLGPSDNGLTGTWASIGALSYNSIKLSPDGANQYYHAGGWIDGELVYVPIGIFDGSAAPPSGHSLAAWPVNCINRVALYVGRASDPTTLTLADDSWLSATGSASDFDGGEVIGANNIAEVGNEWRYYYGADQDTHHQTPELTRLMGLATVGRRRVGKVSGTGNVILTPVAASTNSTHVTINSTGTVKVELLHPTTGAVLTGYSSSDCDAIPSDTYGQLVTWGGSPRTPAAYKARLLVTSGTVHYVTIEEGASLTPAAETDAAQPLTFSLRTAGLTLDPNPYWQQSGTALTVHAMVGRRREVSGVVTSSTGGPFALHGAGAADFEVSLNGTDWASSVIVPAGDTPVWLAAQPAATGAVSAELGVPA